ncbi:hypothetical protein [Pseudonocardia cypriaca]|uniref:Molybdopterin/thiamine biosynthesis adenylyltransferase n=1 Tax=Pseudonocardia cypriaca TaxID=882449 RepID=A0A543FMF4_9PSEU|nr:hypothetical protein [Pseudonocardia cypriaca]TQM35038.1 molybdopterin/thiamine biosynthesis adenylyltransferase [Pseudonocardia cypriaca]
MRPLLRDHVWYVSAPDGAYVHGLGGACTLTGSHTYELLDRVAPHLTGEQTLDQLVAGLPDRQQTAVRDLVEALAAQQFVVDAGNEDRPHTLTAGELSTYAAEIAFIRFGLDSAERRFQQLREARIGLVGDGPVLGELLRAGVWSGWRHTRVVAAAADVDSLLATPRRDDLQEIRVDPADGPLDAWLPGLVRDLDVVLQVSGDASRADLITVARECHRTGTPLGQLLVDRAEAWMVPVGPAAETAAESCWRRLAPPPRTEDDWLLGPVPGLVAAQLALSCTSHLTGLDTLPAPDRPPGVPVLIGTDLRTLVTRIHRVSVHPRAEARERSPEAAPEERIGGPAVDGAALLDTAADLVDARTGLLRSLAEDELVQVPLAVCRARVADPGPVLPAWVQPPAVYGWGADRRAARLRALLAGLAVNGSLTAPANPGDLWGVDPISGARHRVRALPAPVVPFQPPVGAAAALSWDDAVVTGLRDHCEAILRGDDRPDRAVVDLPALVAETDDARVAELHDLLRIAGLDVRVEDLGDRLKLPAFSMRAGTGLRATVCATTVADALHDGLERLLLQWQTGLHPGRALAPARTGDGSGIPELVEALQRHGHVPVVVPTAHDPALREHLGHVVQVVLHGD